MATIYDVLMGDISDEEKMAAMAKRLRMQEQFGRVSQATGHPALAPMGKQQVDQAAQLREQINQAYQPRPTGYPGSYLPGGGRPPVIDPVTQQLMREKHARDIEIQGMENEARIEAAKSRRQPFRRMSQNRQDKENSYIRDTKNLMDTAKAYKPKYSQVIGPLGPLNQAALWTAEKGWIPQLKEEATWWKNWYKFHDLVRRHELFGSALTVGETAAWKAANIAPDTDPEIAQKAINDLMQMLQEDADKRAASHLAGDINPKLVHVMYGELANPEYFEEYGVEMKPGAGVRGLHTPVGGMYETKEAVRDAMQQGKLTRDQAEQLLIRDFGMD